MAFVRPSSAVLRPRRRPPPVCRRAMDGLICTPAQARAGRANWVELGQAGSGWVKLELGQGWGAFCGAARCRNGAGRVGGGVGVVGERPVQLCQKTLVATLPCQNI